MELHYFEATNGECNWGKFAVGAFGPEEWSWVSEVTGLPVLRERGWNRGDLLVLDLETREAAVFRPGGVASSDLRKHRVWVCVLFERFLQWLYEQDTSDLAALPKHVNFAEVPPAQYGYRRAGGGSA